MIRLQKQSNKQNSIKLTIKSVFSELSEVNKAISVSSQSLDVLTCRRSINERSFGPKIQSFAQQAIGQYKKTLNSDNQNQGNTYEPQSAKAFKKEQLCDVKLNEKKLQRFSLNVTCKIQEMLNPCQIIRNFTSLSVFFKYPVQFQSLYRANVHGFSAIKFHQLCDNINDTIVVCKTKNNQIIGGFTPLTWNENFNAKKTFFKTDIHYQTFLFSITKNQKYPLSKCSKNKAICCFNGWGPTFGYDLQIGNFANKSYSSSSYFPRNFDCKTNPTSSQYFTGCKTNQFRVVDWEVYKVLRIKPNKQNNIHQMMKKLENINF